MHTAVDLSKDQTYFLYGMTQDHINKTLFPLGSMTKTQTREIARKLNLNIAEKSESQDICFIPNGDYAEFIEKEETERARALNKLFEMVEFKNLGY